MQIARDKSTQRTGGFLASQARRKQQQRQKVDHWLLLTPSLFLCRLLYRVANSDHDAQRGRSYLSIHLVGRAPQQPPPLPPFFFRVAGGVCTTADGDLLGAAAAGGDGFAAAAR